MTPYDYIIIGAGAAGLLLADALGKDDFFSGKSILILDKDDKKANDRTWCFWEKGQGNFDAIIHKKWNHIYFGGQEFSNRFDIGPYTYKMVRGIDFYNAHLTRIRSCPNIVFLKETVTQINERDDEVQIVTDKNSYLGKQVFNNIYDPDLLKKQTEFPVLQQHFIGWFITTEKPVFDTDQATFMDFSIPQRGNTRFMYVLPFSKTEALVEYTLFSENLLEPKEYESAIKDYIGNDLNCDTYEIVDKERGSIPMTCYDFSQHDNKNLLHIGTAGGWAKPSTGYTFYNSLKKTRQLVAFLKKGKSLRSFTKKTKFWYYDLLLLDILHRDNSKGRYIFETLFKNCDPRLILKFLDEDTGLWEDLKIITGCPKWEFTKALLQRLFG